jgi:hypothetical protein
MTLASQGIICSLKRELHYSLTLSPIVAQDENEFIDAAFGNPAFPHQGIRDFLSLHYYRFGVVILLRSGSQNKSNNN